MLVSQDDKFLVIAGTGPATIEHGLGFIPAVFVMYVGDFETPPTLLPSCTAITETTAQIIAQPGYSWQALVTRTADALSRAGQEGYAIRMNNVYLGPEVNHA